ncbi:MAG TPA: (2Fe-2S)-binding protein [Steroidobacteraceae bacterium]|jgi:isoquinoline 1-oxidoreductase alpha subunit|nr:(2Fe-2S)-binding protein [Steroidobacteraceae bacterium]
MFNLTINGMQHDVEVEPDTPLLWVLRDAIGLTGTKFGCGIGLCGACSVLLDGQIARSCTMAVNAVANQPIITIEGLSPDGSHPVQRAWVQESVPQCGYCQSGMILAAAALLKRVPQPSDADIDGAMTNICRCGTYARVRKAIYRAAALQADSLKRIADAAGELS